MEAVDNIPPAPRLWGGKVGRNEARKLAATFSNNVGVAFFLAAFLQPSLAFVQQDRVLGLATAGASAIFFLLAIIGLLIGQTIARRLED